MGRTAHEFAALPDAGNRTNGPDAVYNRLVMRGAEVVIGRLCGCGAVRAAGILLALSAVLFGQVTINEFSVPTANGAPVGITRGPDGNLWFTEQLGNKIGRITTGGVVTEFPIPTAGSGPYGITSGPDGNLWFMESYGKVGRITTGGVITEFPISTAGIGPEEITSGPDGNLWSTGLGDRLWRITTGGSVTGFALATSN